MIARANRLTARSIGKVKEEGRLFRGESLATSVLARNDNKPSRFAFVVSTKVSNRAFKRNKIKRILREVVRKKLPKLTEGFDTVFFVKKKILKKKRDEIESDVLDVLEKAGLT